MKLARHHHTLSAQDFSECPILVTTTIKITRSHFKKESTLNKHSNIPFILNIKYVRRTSVALQVGFRNVIAKMKRLEAPTSTDITRITDRAILECAFCVLYYHQLNRWCSTCPLQFPIDCQYTIWESWLYGMDALHAEQGNGTTGRLSHQGFVYTNQWIVAVRIIIPEIISFHKFFGQFRFRKAIKIQVIVSLGQTCRSRLGKFLNTTMK